MARPRKPTHLKLVQGTARKDRINPAEPMPPPGIPERPPYLSEEARTAWDKYSVLLSDLGVLTVADGLALGRLAQLQAEVLELTRAIENHGRVFELIGKNGARIFRSRPEVSMLADADRRLMSMLQQFGLTPAARSKVAAAPGKRRQDAGDEFFR